MELWVRSRSTEGTDQVMVHSAWAPASAAVVICDMWDTHHCVSAAARAEDMAPRMNELVSHLRAAGGLIVHAPAGCMDFYRDTPARLRAMQAPRVEPPVSVDWQDWNEAREAPLPPSLVGPTPCSCEATGPCGAGGPPWPWTRQTAAIHISAEDAVTDDGQELYSLLQHRGIEDVIVMGVHTNLCVLGRPYGIRQLTYLGKRPLLCRDLTDSFHRDLRGHFWGTRQIVAHIERHWCPTVTSDQLDGGARFRFRADS